MKQLEIYLRKEPTTCPLTMQEAPEVMGKPFAHDVVMYRDKTATERVGVYRWHIKKPDRRTKWVFHNCYRYRAIWLEDLKP